MNDDAARAKRLREIAELMDGNGRFTERDDLRNIADSLDRPVPAGANAERIVNPEFLESCPRVDLRCTSCGNLVCQTGRLHLTCPNCLSVVMLQNVKSTIEARLAPVPAPAGVEHEKAWAVFGIEGNIVSVWLVEKSAKLTAENFEGATVAPVLIQRLDREPAAAQESEEQRLRFAMEYASVMISDREQIQGYLKRVLAASPAVEKQPEPVEFVCDECGKVHKLDPSKPCPKCGQSLTENTVGGEYPCSICGIPTLHDPPAAAQPEAPEGETAFDAKQVATEVSQAVAEAAKNVYGADAGWIQTVTVEADGSRTVRLPKDEQDVEFETPGGVKEGFARDCRFCLKRNPNRFYEAADVTRWRPQPEKPETKETTERDRVVAILRRCREYIGGRSTKQQEIRDEIDSILPSLKGATNAYVSACRMDDVTRSSGTSLMPVRSRRFIKIPNGKMLPVGGRGYDDLEVLLSETKYFSVRLNRWVTIRTPRENVVYYWDLIVDEVAGSGAF